MTMKPLRKCMCLVLPVVYHPDEYCVVMSLVVGVDAFIAFCFQLLQMFQYNNKSSLTTCARDEAVQVKVTIQLSKTAAHCKVSWPTTELIYAFSMCRVKMALNAQATRGGADASTASRLSIMWFLYDDWLVPLGAPTLTVKGRRNFINIFISSFIFMISYSD